MRSDHHDHVLNVSDLIDRPGASRRVRLRVGVPDSFELPLVTLAEEIAVEGVVESVVDGLLVRGEVRVAATLECARCLAPVPGSIAADVADLFQDPARVGREDEAPEAGFEIREGTIDLDTLLRDSLAAATPLRPLCRPDCAGLCPTCGAALNETTCDCADEVHDDRWAALLDLELPSGRETS